jgi:hypothetical protein
MSEREIKIPLAYPDARSHQDKVLFALFGIGEGRAEDVIRRIELLEPGVSCQEVIAVTHLILTELHASGTIIGREESGNILYSLKS